MHEQGESKFWKYATYVIYTCVALFPFTYFNSFLYWGTSVRSVLLILAMSVLGIVYAVGLFKKDNTLSFPKSLTGMVLIIYFVSLIISGIVGLSFENTFWSVAPRTTGLWYIFNLGLLVFFLVHVLSDRVKQEKLILTVIVSTALYSFLAFLSPEGVNMLFFGFASDGFTFGNSSFAAMYIFGAFILSLYYVFRAEVRKWWMYTLPVVILLSPEIIRNKLWFGDTSEGIWGDARATTYVILLSLVCMLCMWAVSKIRDIKLKTKVAYGIFCAGMLGIVIFAISLFSSDGFVRQAYLSQSTAIRPLLWEMSIGLIQDRPFFGWGADNFERIFEKNYDNRFLQDEYGNEAWFDRAHNVFIDQGVDNGVIGLLLYMGLFVSILLCLIYTTLKSTEKNDRVLAAFLIVYFPLHLLELQTAFDTSISYPILALMMALSIVLYQRARIHVKGGSCTWTVPDIGKYIIACSLIAFLVWSLVWGWIPFVRAQMRNGDVRRAGSSEKRIPLYEVMFASPVDEHAFLWRTTTDLQRGIGQNPDVIQDPEQVAGFKKEVALFTDAYREYVSAHPTHFRAHLNLADILIYQRLLGIDKLQEAQDVLDKAIKLVPQSPQPYWMKAVAYIYMKKFESAREYAQKGLALNPEIKQSQKIVEYVEKSIKDFPDIDLYFFRQI